MATDLIIDPIIRDRLGASDVLIKKLVMYSAAALIGIRRKAEEFYGCRDIPPYNGVSENAFGLG